MPTLEEILPSLTNAKMFTTLDLKDGLYQIGLDEESSKKTTFWTPFGRYRYLRMPFGINITPEKFECRLHEVLADLDGVEMIRDDLLVVGYGDTLTEAEENHDANLRKPLERARAVNMKLNSKEAEGNRGEVHGSCDQQIWSQTRSAENESCEGDAKADAQKGSIKSACFCQLFGKIYAEVI